MTTRRHTVSRADAEFGEAQRSCTIRTLVPGCFRPGDAVTILPAQGDPGAPLEAAVASADLDAGVVCLTVRGEDECADPGCPVWH